MRAILAGAVLAGLGLASSAARGDDEFPLAWQDIPNAEAPIAFLAGRSAYPVPLDAAKGLRLPKAPGAGVVIFPVTLAGKSTHLVVTTGKSPELYVDANLDGDLSNEKPIAGAAMPGMPPDARRFGPATIGPADAKDRAAVVVRVDLPYLGSVRYYPGRYRAGTLTLAGQKYAFSLVDANMNGRYDDTLVLTGGRPQQLDCDAFGLDLNADGTLDPEREVFPLTRVLPLLGAYYRLTVAPDGSSVRVGAPTSAPSATMGALDVGPGGLELLVWSEQGCQWLSGDKGVWSLPVGRYVTMLGRLSRKDKAGKTWTMTPQAFNVLDAFDIAAGKTLTHKMGAPLTAQTDVQQAGPGEVTIGLTIVGQGGETYAPAADGADPVAPPGIRILDKNAKELASGSFAFG
jgi:hypothetical protein